MATLCGFLPKHASFYIDSHFDECVEGNYWMQLFACDGTHMNYNLSSIGTFSFHVFFNHFLNLFLFARHENPDVVEPHTPFRSITNVVLLS